MFVDTRRREVLKLFMSKPSKPEGSRVELWGLGPFLLPHIARVEDAMIGDRTDLALIRVKSVDQTEAWLPILDRAAASLVNAQNQTSALWDKEIQSIPVSISGMEQPVELPLLVDFACLVQVESDHYLLGFLGEADRRILVPISSEAYQVLLVLCINLPAVFANRKK